MPDACVIGSSAPQAGTPKLTPFEFWELVEDMDSRNRLEGFSYLDRRNSVVCLHEEVNVIRHDLKLLQLPPIMSASLG